MFRVNTKKMSYEYKGFLDNITVLLWKSTQYDLFLMQRLANKMNTHECWNYTTDTRNFKTDNWGVFGVSACLKGDFTTNVFLCSNGWNMNKHSSRSDWGVRLLHSVTTANHFHIYWLNWTLRDKVMLLCAAVITLWLILAFIMHL